MQKYSGAMWGKVIENWLVLFYCSGWKERSLWYVSEGEVLGCDCIFQVIIMGMEMDSCQWCKNDP